MKTNWLAFYDERKQFRKNMRGISPEECERLARLDTTIAMQNKERLDHKQASERLAILLETRQMARRKTT